MSSVNYQTEQNTAAAGRSRVRKRTRSIARGIHRSVWFGKFGSFLFLDLAIAVTLVVLLTVMVTRWPERTQEITDASVTADRNYVELTLELEDGSVENYRVTPESLTRMSEDENVRQWQYGSVMLLSVILTIQCLDLFFELFRTGKIRRRLRPLDELAQKAEAFSAIPLDTSNLEHLEEAIRNASEENTYENGELKISTGDDDLKSIETALNGLLRRMQEGYRQQVRFVSDASHELRTPIAVIQGYADMLDRWGKTDPEILQEGITSIRNESEHMHNLVEQLLFLARGDSGRNTLNKEVFDLTGVVEEAAVESEMIDPAHVYEFDPGDPPVQAYLYGDASMIKQSVRIFLQNAAKYSEAEGRILLAVRRSGQKVSYVIQDEGIGMSEEDTKHIFERFYRSGEARDRGTGGTGLGLSIAKWIIDAHGGSIDVVSRQDFGTRFTVTFPAAAQEQIAAAEAAAAAEKAAAEAAAASEKAAAVPAVPEREPALPGKAEI
ncbi:MAG: HAMP domain-containing histidine kinase [Lachnospiraceae bacterium]|nr:HAMP domain-containing histidine kinase [Lachnospiraceae bacterium]MBR2996386.1 HAMP domain-containing histidine kinase [Lachnospiraceae bacterium]